MVDEIFEAFEDLFEWRKDKKKGKGKKGQGEPAPVEHVPASTAQPAAPKAPPVFCIDCGSRNEGDARFCADCGGILPSPGAEMRCPGCNRVVPMTAKFCPGCGSRVAVS